MIWTYFNDIGVKELSNRVGMRYADFIVPDTDKVTYHLLVKRTFEGRLSKHTMPFVQFDNLFFGVAFP